MFISHRARRLFTERVRRLIGGLPCRIQVAALPWRDGVDGVEVMLITSRGTGRWVLPKGWPEGDERLHQSAAREAVEEAGLTGVMEEVEAGRFYYSKSLSRDREWRCEVRVFALEVADVADDWPERGQRERRWFKPEEAARLVAEPDLGEIIARFDRAPREFAA